MCLPKSIFKTVYYLMSGECILLGSISSQQKFEAKDVRALRMSQLPDRLCYSSRVLDRPCWCSQISSRPCYSSQTDQCYNSVLSSISFRKQENTPLRCEGMPTQRCEEKRRGPQPFGSSFYMFFPTQGLPYVNWASQKCCSFSLRSSLWSSDLPLFYFCGIFPFLSFSHCHSGLLFPIITT